MSNPQVTTLDALRPALVAAQKYEIISAIGGLRTTLVSPLFLESDPLGVYAIACELGLKDEARAGTYLVLYLA
jgi:hypothetical protein